MNWTGGSRARNNKSSSNITRLQKRYFAKVRAQNPAPLTHVDSSFNPGNNSLLLRKRKKTCVPDFDIVLPKDTSYQEGLSQKRRHLGSEDLALSGEIRATPESSIQSFGKGDQRGNGLKTKKQLLLEKDSWVCTEVSRPLVLKNKDEGLGGMNIRPVARGAIIRPPKYHRLPLSGVNSGEGLGICAGEPQEPNDYRYPSLERRSIYPRRNVQGRGRRLRSGAFRNLSDGGYVQIGGSTQSRNNDLEQQEPLAREMSHISEDTMLFDLEGQPEEYGLSPQRQSIPTRDPISGESVETMPVRKVPKAPVYNLNGWNANRDLHVNNGLLSSPLAPYSQNINSRGLLGPIDPFNYTSSQPVRDIIEEIDAAASDVVSSTPSTILSTIYVRPETTHSLREPLLPFTTDTQEALGRPVSFHREYQTGSRGVGASQKRNNGLNHLLEENIEDIQNQSLIVYASSICSSPPRDNGEDWMLGSGISTKPYQSLGNTDCIPTRECEDDWESFLKTHTVTEVNVTDMHKDMKEDDVQEHLEEIGIWDRQVEPGGLEGTFIGNHNGHDDEESDSHSNQVENYIGGKNTEEIAILKSHPTLRLAQPPLLLENEREEASWRDFATGLPDKLGDTNTIVGDKSDLSAIRAAKSCSGTLSTIEGLVNEKSGLPDSNPSDELSKLVLELDKDEDSAWRAFVFGGLGDEIGGQEDLELPKPPKKGSRPPKLLQKPLLRTSPSPGLRLPSPPIHPSQPIYAPSMAGATVGSGSIESSESNSSVTDSSVTDSSPTQKRSKFFNPNPLSSPLASPVSIVPTRPYKSRNMVPIGWRGESNLYSPKLDKNVKDKIAKLNAERRALKHGGGKPCKKDEIEDIEDW